VILHVEISEALERSRLQGIPVSTHSFYDAALTSANGTFQGFSTAV